MIQKKENEGDAACESGPGDPLQSSAEDGERISATPPIAPAGCDCMDRIEEQLIGIEVKGRKVVGALFADFGFTMTGDTLYYSRINIDLEGRKKPYEHKMIHAFCPFCGTKYARVSDQKDARNERSPSEATEAKRTPAERGDPSSDQTPKQKPQP